MKLTMTGIAVFLTFSVGVLSIVTFIASGANAGINQWTACDPIYGGIIRDIAIGNRKIYVATRANGIFYSENGGENWQQLVWPNEYMLSLAVDKNNPDIMYTGKLGGQVSPSRCIFRSIDGGKHWSRTTMTNCIARCLVIDPIESSIIYAGTDRGVFRSNDNGKTWRQIKDGLLEQTIYTILIDTINPDIVYLGTRSGVFRSSDRGMHFKRLGLAGIRVNALVTDISDPNIIIAGTYPSGFYRSDDGGKSWEHISIDPLDFWGYGCVSSLAVDPVDANIIYGATHCGMFRSEDRGKSWILVGFQYRHVESFAVDVLNEGENVENSSILYAGIWGGGVYRSVDNGDSWIPINTGLSACVIQTLAIDPSNPDTIYSGTFGQGLFRSVDAGKSWTLMDSGMPYFEFMDIEMSPSNPNTIYAALYYLSSVFRSRNRGEMWEQVRGKSSSFISLAITTDGWVYAGTDGSGIHRSIDWGNTWTNGGLENEFVWSIAVDPVEENIIYAGTWGDTKGVFRSDNAGEDWVQVLKYAPVVSLAIDPCNTDIVYAGTFGGGVLRTADKGENWETRNNGLRDLHIWSLAINPKDPKILYAGTEAGGVSRSTNEGRTWTSMNRGLESIHVQSLVIDAQNPQNIYAGVAGGVFKYTIVDYDNTFLADLSPGLNMISLPLMPRIPYTARSFAKYISATVVIKYDETLCKFVGFTSVASDDGFIIEGGKGYIVNIPEGGVVKFVGAAWTNEAPPMTQETNAWAFVVSGSVLDGEGMSASDGGYTAIVKYPRTGEILTEAVDTTGYFAAASADLSRKAVISAGDQVEVAVMDSSGKIVSGPFIHDIRLNEIRNAVANLPLKLGDIIPEKSALLQNYPNPFNPETWIPFELAQESEVILRIYDTKGSLIREMSIGKKPAGSYIQKSKAVHWDGRNDGGERVASDVYFYTLQAGDFAETRKMILAE